MICLRTLITCSVLSFLCLLTPIPSRTQEAPTSKPDLHKAIWKGDIATVRKLLNQGVSVTHEGPQGYTPLYEAVDAYESFYQDSVELRNTRKEIATLLLAQGANPNAAFHSRTDHRTILQVNPFTSSTMLRLLLAHGANPNPKSKEWSPLMVMAASGKYENVQAMVEAGAHLEFRDLDGSTALMHAAGWGNSDTPPWNTDDLAMKVLDILLKKGANIDARDKYGDTALIYAAGAGHGPLVKYLVEHGANIKLRNHGGIDALTMIAGQGRNDPGVQALLARGAKVGPVEALLMHEDDTFARLMDQGADLHGRGPSGANLLILAAEQGDLPLVKLLLTKGFKINSTDRRGATPLILAVAGRPHERMPDGWGFPDVEKSGSGRLQLVEFLLSQGADINAKMEMGGYVHFTALNMAEEAERYYSALDIAEKAEAENIVNLLKEWGGEEAVPEL